MKRRSFLAGGAALAGVAAVSPFRLAAATSPISDGQTNALRLTWPDLGTDWTDGLPLANGELGLMAWSRSDQVTLSLDRSDVWDMRSVPEFEEPGFTYRNLLALRTAGNTAEIARLFEKPFHTPGRGKLPLGRILLGLDAADVLRSTLDLAGATGEIVLKDGTAITMLVVADRPIGLIRLKGPRAASIAAAMRVESPPFGQPPSPPRDADKRNALDYGGANDLGYDAPLELSGDGLSGYASGRATGHFAVLARRVPDGEGVAIIWTIATAPSRAAAVAAARARLGGRQSSAALDAIMARHTAWWARFWSPVTIETGDRVLDTRWRLSTYHLGAGAREGGAPMPLQAPWTWDNGRLPAWKGDYHHDLNTQMTYWPAYAGNRPEISRNLIDWLWATREEGVRFARTFYGAPGLALPGTADLANRALGGWAAYSYSPTVTAWLLHHFDLHWRYFGDTSFLRERAYPYAQGVTTFLTTMLKPRPGRTGLFLPLHISPELNDNKLSSWFEEWTNFDLALCRYAFTTAATMADTLGQRSEAAAHRATLARLPDFARDPDGGLSIAAGTTLTASHRHFSHLLAFYPLRLLDPANDPAALAVLNASLARLERLGTKMWMGYSFAWLATFYALAGRAGDARRALATFEEGFSGRNGFHTNGDRSGRGITAFPGRLFTLEGGCAAADAVQTMLLQSGSDTIRLFPAMEPGSTSRFTGLRTALGIKVDARIDGAGVASVELRGNAVGKVKVTGPMGFARDAVLQPGVPWAWAR